MDDTQQPDWGALHDHLEGSLLAPETMRQHPDLPAGPSDQVGVDQGNINSPLRHFQGDKSIDIYANDVGNAYQEEMRKAGVPEELYKKTRADLEQKAKIKARAYALHTMQKPPGVSEYAQYLPVVGHAVPVIKGDLNERTAKAFEEGSAEPWHYQHLAGELAREDEESKRGWWERRLHNFLGIAQFAGDMAATGGIGGGIGRAAATKGATALGAGKLGVRAAGAAGYGLGATVAMPERVLSEYAERGERKLEVDPDGGLALDPNGRLVFSKADDPGTRAWKAAMSGFIDNTLMPGVAGAFTKAGAGSYAARVFKKALMATAGVEVAGDTKKILALSPQGGPAWNVGAAIRTGDPEKVKHALQEAAGTMVEMGALELVTQLGKSGHSVDSGATALLDKFKAQMEKQGLGPALTNPSPGQDPGSLMHQAARESNREAHDKASGAHVPLQGEFPDDTGKAQSPVAQPPGESPPVQPGGGPPPVGAPLPNGEKMVPGPGGQPIPESVAAKLQQQAQPAAAPQPPPEKLTPERLAVNALEDHYHAEVKRLTDQKAKPAAIDRLLKPLAEKLDQARQAAAARDAQERPSAPVETLPAEPPANQAAEAPTAPPGPAEASSRPQAAPVDAEAPAVGKTGAVELAKQLSPEQEYKALRALAWSHEDAQAQVQKRFPNFEPSQSPKKGAEVVKPAESPQGLTAKQKEYAQQEYKAMRDLGQSHEEAKAQSQRRFPGFEPDQGAKKGAKALEKGSTKAQAAALADPARTHLGVGDELKSAFPSAELKDRGEWEAKLGKKIIYVGPDDGPATVRIDFEDTSKAGVQQSLQSGSLEFFKHLSAFAKDLAAKGVGIEFRAIDSNRPEGGAVPRAEIYGRILRRAGLEPVGDGPNDQGYHKWQPAQTKGASLKASSPKPVETLPAEPPGRTAAQAPAMSQAEMQERGNRIQEARREKKKPPLSEDKLQEAVTNGWLKEQGIAERLAPVREAGLNPDDARMQSITGSDLDAHEKHVLTQHLQGASLAAIGATKELVERRPQKKAYTAAGVSKIERAALKKLGWDEKSIKEYLDKVKDQEANRLLEGQEGEGKWKEAVAEAGDVLRDEVSEDPLAAPGERVLKLRDRVEGARDPLERQELQAELAEAEREAADERRDLVRAKKEIVEDEQSLAQRESREPASLRSEADELLSKEVAADQISDAPASLGAPAAQDAATATPPGERGEAAGNVVKRFRSFKEWRAEERRLKEKHEEATRELAEAAQDAQHGEDGLTPDESAALIRSGEAAAHGEIGPEGSRGSDATDAPGQREPGPGAAPAEAAPGLDQGAAPEQGGAELRGAGEQPGNVTRGGVAPQVAQSIADLARRLATEEAGHYQPGYVPYKIAEAVARAIPRLTKYFEGVGHSLDELGGKMAPRLSSLSQDAGNKLARFIAAPFYARLAIPRFIDHVMGPQATEADCKLAGAVLTERALRYTKFKFGDEARLRSNDGTRLQQEARAVDQQRQQAIAQQAAPEAIQKLQERQDFLENASQQSFEAARKADQKARDVASIIGQKDCPLTSFADYQQHLQSPFMQKIIKNWRDEFAKKMDENFRRMQGLEDSDPIDTFTQIPGEPINLKAVRLGMTSGLPKDAVVTGAGEGNLRNVRQGRNPFNNSRTGAADAYVIDIREIMANTLERGEALAAKADMYRSLVESGVARWGKYDGRYADVNGAPGEAIPDVKPPKGTQDNAPGEDALYVDQKAHKEVRKALNVDQRFSLGMATDLLNGLTKVNILSTAEATWHTKNNLTMLAKPGMRPWEVFSEAYHLLRKDSETMKRVAELARIGVSIRYGEGLEQPTATHWANPQHWMGSFLEILDTSTRLAGENAFKRLSERPEGFGRVEASGPKGEANKRDFLNQVGQYNKRAQHDLVVLLRETGMGPFATAGSNYFMQGLRALIMDPGVKGQGTADALALRGEMLVRHVGVLTAAAVANYALWKNVWGDDQTPMGGIKVGEGNGKTSYVDATAWLGASGLLRGARETGLLAVSQAVRKGQPVLEARDKAAEQAAHSALHPFVGPGVAFGYTALTGKNTMGHDVTGERPAHIEDKFAAAAKNVNPSLAALKGWDRPQEQVPQEERLWKLAGPFGVQYRKK